MGFKFEHTDLASVAKLATLAGRAQSANAQAARDERSMQQIRSIEAAKEMAEFNAQLDMQRMKFEASRQLDAEMRSHEWQMQKMQITSQLDFEREEKKRMRALSEYDAAVKYIDDSDIFDDSDKEKYKFKAKMNLLNQGVSDRALFPELYNQGTEKQVSPTQRISAMIALRDEDYQDPNFAQKALSKLTGGFFGEEELEPDIQAQKEILESVVRGEYNAQPNIPSGTISSGLPEVKNDADFDALPSGTEFIDPDGIKRRKP